jgi:two-component system, sensor histidine kinase
MANILFIEDEKWGVDPYFKTLATYHHTCSLVTTGDEAIEKLSTNTYHLISMDLMFQPGNVIDNNEDNPTHAGLILLDQIRSGKITNCNAQIPVIILTAVINHSIEEKVRNLGVADYLKKPIEFNIVIDTILKHCP